MCMISYHRNHIHCHISIRTCKMPYICIYMHIYGVCVCVCVCVRARACVRACVRERVSQTK